MDESERREMVGNEIARSNYVEELAGYRRDLKEMKDRVERLIRLSGLMSKGIAALMRDSPRQLPFDEKAFHEAKREWDDKSYDKLSEGTKRLVDTLPEILFGRHAKWSALDKIEGISLFDPEGIERNDETGVIYPEYVFHYEVYDQEVNVYFPMLSMTREWNIDCMKYEVVVSPIDPYAPYELLAIDDDLSVVISELKKWLDDVERKQHRGTENHEEDE